MGVWDFFFGTPNTDPNTGYAYPSSVQRRAPNAPISAAPGDVQKPFGDTTIPGKYPGRLVPTVGPGSLSVTQEVGGNAAPGQPALAQDVTRMVKTTTFNPQASLVARPDFTAFARPVNPVMMAMPVPRPNIPASPGFSPRLPADPRAWFAKAGPDTVRAYAPVPQASPVADVISGGRVLPPATVTRTAPTATSRKTQAASVSKSGTPVPAKAALAAAPVAVPSAPVPSSRGSAGSGINNYDKAGGPSPGSTQTKSFTSTRPSANASVSKSASGNSSRSTTTKR